jgi:hypothetical protein
MIAGQVRHRHALTGLKNDVVPFLTRLVKGGTLAVLS